MLILLYIALGYLLVTTGILYLNYSDFKPLAPTPRQYFDQQAPEVSICIPARNEAETIERCVRSAAAQQYPNYHIYVLDDGSTDGTSEILANLATTFKERLSVIEGKPKPDGWLGKSWACHQLSEKATGEILIFIDADTWLEPEAAAKVTRTMGKDVVDLITLWPEQELGSYWEKTVIPLLYFALLTLLPSRYVHRFPRWIPPFLRKKLAPLFAAACGQFMAFRSEAYHSIGGHQSVKNQVVEDVELAKNIKRAGFSVKMYHGRKTVHCRMYTSAQELWDGFRKNFLAGFGNIYLFIAMGLLHIITFILPVIALPFLIIFGPINLVMLCSLVIALMLLQRYIIDRWFDWNPKYGLLHPLGVGWFQMLGLQVLVDYVNNKSAQWKDRPV
jgi:chlorobactene glucosyltransferase